MSLRHNQMIAILGMTVVAYNQLIYGYCDDKGLQLQALVFPGLKVKARPKCYRGCGTHLTSRCDNPVSI